MVNGEWFRIGGKKLPLNGCGSDMRLNISEYTVSQFDH